MYLEPQGLPQGAEVLDSRLQHATQNERYCVDFLLDPLSVGGAARREH